MSTDEHNHRNLKQGSLLPDFVEDNSPKKLYPKKFITTYQAESNDIITAIPSLVLPTRWEHLQPRMERKRVPIRTIIKPVSEAINIMREVIEYVRTTDGAQVLVVRAETGSGKTTFLNTLPYYLQDVSFNLLVMDLQNLTEEEFGEHLWKMDPDPEALNLIVLEGREKPESITDAYVQVVLAHINRFARQKAVPIIFVIPTIEEQVARNWCNHGAKIGDLIPEKRLYEGSRWYTFPGVPREKYIDIAEETVRALNPPYGLVDFGVSPDELKNWSDVAQTIGEFIGILATEISARRRRSSIPLKGPRERVWIIYCSPDHYHYDRTYYILNGLVQDESFKVSPVKLVAPSSDSTFATHWRKGKQWEKLVTTVNFLDIRLINLPITTVVTAALAYGDNNLIESFKRTTLEVYKDQIPEEMQPQVTDWKQSLYNRRLQIQNARDSMESTNLFRLLRGMPAEQMKGGNRESPQALARYLHLRNEVPEEHLHYYIGCTLRDTFLYHRVSGYIDVATEYSLVPNQTSPVPDVTVYTDNNIYALECHFRQTPIASSEVSRYALRSVLEKYMRDLPHLSSQLARQ